MNWNIELSAQLDWYWSNGFRPRLAGLTDQEYLWEPVEGCWSVRPIGNGKYMADYQWPEPSPPPVTTIAWRMSHLAGPILAWRNCNHFGGPSFDIQTFDWPGRCSPPWSCWTMATPDGRQALRRWTTGRLHGRRALLNDRTPSIRWQR